MEKQKLQEFKRGRITVKVYKNVWDSETFNFNVVQEVKNKLGLIEIGNDVFDTERKLNNYLKRLQE